MEEVFMAQEKVGPLEEPVEHETKRDSPRALKRRRIMLRGCPKIDTRSCIPISEGRDMAEVSLHHTPDAAPEGMVHGLLQTERWSWLKSPRQDRMGIVEGDPGYDHTTLMIPEEAWQGMKGFDRQYWKLKSCRMDLVLFVRCGHFYNLFDTDADVGMKVGLKPCGKPKVNMWKVGCTHSGFRFWANKVLAAGYAVGRVEEVGLAASKSRLMERSLEAIYTPGIALEDEHYNPDDYPETRHVLCIVELDSEIGICRFDSSTFRISSWQFHDGPERRNLSTALMCNNPAEIVYIQHQLTAETLRAVLEFRRVSEFTGVSRINLPVAVLCEQEHTLQQLKNLTKSSKQRITETENPESLYHHIANLQCGGYKAALKALCLLANQLERSQCLQRVMGIASYCLEGSLRKVCRQVLLDNAALQNLHILEGFPGTSDGSLIKWLSNTASAAGQRLLVEWVCNPLQDIAEISRRHHAVEFLVSTPSIGRLFHKHLRGLADGEKTLGSILSLAHGMPLPKDEDAKQLSSVLTPKVVQLLRSVKGLIHAVGELALPPCQSFSGNFDLFNMAKEAASHAKLHLDQIRSLADIDEEMEPWLIPSSKSFPEYNSSVLEKKCQIKHLQEQLDGLRHAISRNFLLLEGKAPQRRNLLLIKYAGKNLSGLERLDHQYHVSVPTSFLPYVPEDWQETRKNKGHSLFRIPAIDGVVKNANLLEQKQHSIYMQFLSKLVQSLVSGRMAWTSLFQKVAVVDVLVAFATACTSDRAENGLQFCRPNLLENSENIKNQIEIEQGWNPLLLGARKPVVCNNICLGGRNPPGLVLFGANSGGKSTLLRMVAISTILAQIGCLVPAKRMKLTCVDQIFTRIGARDNLMSGHSTFALEMQETSIILRNSSTRSLAILDEMGRGTSTKDGYALAFAVLHYLSEVRPCMVLFASHFHGLASEGCLTKILFYHMKITMDSSRRLVPGYIITPGVSSEGSCGIVVAGAADIPESILRAANVHSQRYMRSVHASQTLKASTNSKDNPIQGNRVDLSDDEVSFLDRFLSIGIFKGRKTFSERWCVDLWQLWLDVRHFYSNETQ